MKLMKLKQWRRTGTGTDSGSHSLSRSLLLRRERNPRGSRNGSLSGSLLRRPRKRSRNGSPTVASLSSATPEVDESGGSCAADDWAKPKVCGGQEASSSSSSSSCNWNGRFSDDDDEDEAFSGVTPRAVPYARPLADLAWRGCFEIGGGARFGLMAGHLSDRACFKAVEAAESLPDILPVETSPRLQCWPKFFREVAPPSDDHIAIYFFPDDESSATGYQVFVNGIVERDLALKVQLEAAELLIFGSNRLPLRHRKFRGHHYLWGVFIGRSDSTLSGASGGS